MPYAEALARRFQTDWETVDIPKPEFIGARVLEDVPLDDAARVHRLVAVLSDVGAQRQVPADLRRPAIWARRPASCSTMRSELLDRIVREKLLTARGVYGFWPAASEGDDIIVYADESRTQGAVPLPRAAAAVGTQRAGRVSTRSPISSRPSTAAARIISAHSPSRPASAATSWPRSSTASTTITTRS